MLRATGSSTPEKARRFGGGDSRARILATDDPWRGLNLLGFALVPARAVLRGEL
jgi:hypothetical protein